MRSNFLPRVLLERCRLLSDFYESIVPTKHGWELCTDPAARISRMVFYEFLPDKQRLRRFEPLRDISKVSRLLQNLNSSRHGVLEPRMAMNLRALQSSRSFWVPVEHARCVITACRTIAQNRYYYSEGAGQRTAGWQPPPFSFDPSGADVVFIFQQSGHTTPV